MKKSLRKELIKWAKRNNKRNNKRVLKANFSVGTKHDMRMFEEIGTTLPNYEEAAQQAAERLKNVFQQDKWAPPTKPAPTRMMKPDVNNWMEWAATPPPKTAHNPYILDTLLLHERMRAMYGYLYCEVPDECRVVSLMQNEGE